MESPGDKMEEIYVLPPKLKYTESWLEFKEKRGFTDYWVVLKGTYMFFFKDQNTHAKEQYVGFIGIQVRQTTCTSKKGSEREFTIEMGKKKYRLRANDDTLRSRWIYAIDLVNRADAPGPLPGDLNFKETRDPTPSPNKMKKRANTVAGIPVSQLPRSPLSSLDDSSISSISPREDLSASVKQQLSLDEQTGQDTYDPVFVMPSWFYPDITRSEAEQLLNQQQYGAYLLRPTDKCRGQDCYVLSIMDLEKIRHHKIILLSDNGKCIFESSPNAPFPTPVLAVDYLMRTKYATLNPKPITSGEGRNSGDGQEDVDQHKGEMKCSSSENPYVLSPSSSYPNGNSFDESATSEPPLLPRPPRISTSSLPSPPYMPTLPSPPAVGRVAPGWRQASLPARLPMRNRPLPDLPIYENAQAILKHSRSNGDSYLDMHATSFNENSLNNNHNFFREEEEDIPPPLPRKRNSLPRCPTYENVPRPEEVFRSEYDAPMAYSSRQNDLRKWSHP
eukprot:Seg1074.5 transcript_id=Seg1074.5/GoldUCD/mRNA.D3Y31 product="hypothetical protein" protein_id=Seg1074.5/GoldUCD/D3Y31